MASPYLTDEQAAALRRLGFVPSPVTTSWIRGSMNVTLYGIKQGNGGWYVARARWVDGRRVLDNSPTLPMDALLVWCEVEGFL